MKSTHQQLIIQPGIPIKNYWKDLWFSKELLYIFAWRDISVRYKQTFIGIFWSVIRPFLTMVIFTVIFGKLAKLPTDGDTPYALMVFSALLPWQFFSAAFSDCSTSLVSNANLINKVYFPRLIIPISSIFVCFVDFLIGFLVLIALMFWYGYAPGIQILALPGFILMIFLASLGPGLIFSSLNVKFRDFKYIVPFVIQLGMYISPVGFSSSIIPEKWRLIYSINPLVSIIEGFRWSISGGDSDIYLPGFLISIIIICFFLFLGIRVFRNLERTFSDII